MARATFEIVKRRDGKSKCRFVAPNGTTVMTTPPLSSRYSAIGATLAIRTLAPDAEVVDLSAV